MDQAIINDAIGFAREQFQDDFSGHDYYHTERVYRLALQIARAEDADPFVVSLAALLHDVDDRKLSPATHATKEKAVAFMRSHDLPEDVVRAVVEIIKRLSFAGDGADVPDTLEGKIVQDADRLDAIGAIGIARAFAYGGSHHRSMHDPDEAPRLNMIREEYAMSQSTSINHFYEKLLRLKDSMNTAEGKRMAQKRHGFMEQYLEEFFAEWDGQD